MEILYKSIAALPAIILVIWGWRMLNWAWFKPKELEKRLKEQGLRGTPFKFIYGDLKESVKMDQEARSKPMNLTNDITPRVFPFVDKAMKEYGENCYIWTGPRPAWLLMDHELIKEIFNKNYCFLKVPPGNPLAKLLSYGITSHEKEKWAKHRKLVNPVFQLERIKLMVPAFYESCREMLGKWEKISLAVAEGSFELDVWPHLQGLTKDVISRTAFGSNYENGRLIFKLQQEQSELVAQFAQSVYIPGWRFLPTKNNMRIKEITKQIELLIIEMINKRMELIKAGESRNEDLLHTLLESNSMEIKKRADKKFGMSLNEIIEECKVFHFVGQETTSTLLVWTLILLSKHPDWQDRARDEVHQVIGDKKPHFDEFNQLKVVRVEIGKSSNFEIITMILNEVLRLYPSGTMLSRMTTEETKLGKITLPAGVQIFLPAIFMHHDPKVWGDDVHEFNPDRFSEGIVKATKGHLVYFPFGWGPRICLGQNFAMLEAKMALAMMLQNYSFELSPSYAHAPYTKITLQPQYGAQLILRKF